MTWGRVENAASMGLSALARRGLQALGFGGASHGPATITGKTCVPSETPTLPDLRLRAHRLHNRNPDKAALYLRKHETLAKGVCSDE